MKATIIKPLVLSSLGSYMGIDKIEFQVLDDIGTPLKNHRVDIFLQKTNHFLKSFYSDDNGTIEIFGINIKNGPFFVVTHDESKSFNAVISDHIGGPDYVHEKG